MSGRSSGEYYNYTKVVSYKSNDNPYLIYVSRSEKFINYFFKDRFGTSDNFTFDGEMMVNLKDYYVQVSHGVYKRIYKQEKLKDITPVKLKKSWSLANFKKDK